MLQIGRLQAHCVSSRHIRCQVAFYSQNASCLSKSELEFRNCGTEIGCQLLADSRPHDVKSWPILGRFLAKQQDSLVWMEDVDDHLLPGEESVRHVLARAHGDGALGLKKMREILDTFALARLVRGEMI